jgi:predicted transcriptional regulator
MYTIAVSPEMYTVLRQRAQQVRTSPDKVVEEALRVYFGREEQAWQHAFEGLIAKVQARTLPHSSAEIEADITAAADEVRELRRARRRTD